MEINVSSQQDPDGTSCNCQDEIVSELTTRATPPEEILVAQASIRTHGELFISPSSQNDRTAFDAAFESRKQPVILPLREEEGVAFLVPIYDGEVPLRSGLDPTSLERKIRLLSYAHL